jgi:hypothetical protein
MRGRLVFPEVIHVDIVDLKVYNLPDIYFAEIVRGMAKRVYPTAYVRFGSEADIRLAKFGIVAPVGLRGIKALLEVIMDREVDRR